MLIMIIFVICLGIAVAIVNGAQRLYMKLIGANAMFFSGKKKLIAILVVALFLAAIIVSVFNIPIPKV